MKLKSLSSIEVFFHWGCLLLQSSSIEVVFHWGPLPLTSSSIEVFFHRGHLPLRSSSIEVIFHWDRLPLMSSSIEVVLAYIVKLGSLAALDIYYSRRSAGLPGGRWPSYMKIRLTQPSFIELANVRGKHK